MKLSFERGCVPMVDAKPTTLWAIVSIGNFETMAELASNARRTKRSTPLRRRHVKSGFNVSPAAAAGELRRSA
jgi:hypothetical protein